MIISGKKVLSSLSFKIGKNYVVIKTLFSFQEIAFKNEVGLKDNPLTLTWLGGQPKSFQEYTPGYKPSETVHQVGIIITMYSHSRLTWLSSKGFELN